MKNLLLPLFTAILCSTVAAEPATTPVVTPAPQARCTFGVVRAATVLAPYEKEVGEQVDQYGRSFQNEFVQIEKQFRSQVEMMQKNAPTMKEDEKRAASEQLNQQIIEAQKKQLEIRKKINNHQNILLKNLDNKFRNAVKEVAQEKGLSIVMQQEITPFFDATTVVDITADVSRKMNNSKKATVAAQPAKPATLATK